MAPFYIYTKLVIVLYFGLIFLITWCNVKY